MGKAASKPCSKCKVGIRVPGVSWCKPCRRSWYWADPEKARERNRAYMNTPEGKAVKAKWNKANPGSRLVTTQVVRRRHKYEALGVTGKFYPADWRRILKLQQSRCNHCNKLALLTIDHRVPIVSGGTNDPSNLQGLCMDCNSAKSSQVWEEFHAEYARRFRFRPADYLAENPALFAAVN